MLLGDLPIGILVAIGRLRWLGRHIARRPVSYPARKVIESDPTCRRRRGPQRVRWLDQLEADLRRIGVSSWRFAAQDRALWRHILFTARVDRRLKSVICIYRSLAAQQAHIPIAQSPYTEESVVSTMSLNNIQC